MKIEQITKYLQRNLVVLWKKSPLRRYTATPSHLQNHTYTLTTYILHFNTTRRLNFYVIYYLIKLYIIAVR